MKTRPEVVNRRRALFVLLPAVVLAIAFGVNRNEEAAASVTVTEFADFQCPYCKQAASVVEQLRAKYGNQVQFVFKQMPLPMHKHAFKAAQASVCAQQQNKFWEFHDRLFAAGDLSAANLNELTLGIGLDLDQFSKCLVSETSRLAVEHDIVEADRLGVQGTPTFFVDGQLVKGAATLLNLKQSIDQALGSQPRPLTKRDSLPLSPTASPKLTSQFSDTNREPSSVTTQTGLTLSSANINFGYQLLSTTSASVVETVSNFSTAPLVITDVSISGRDRRDFISSYAFKLPVSVTPGASVAIDLTFGPNSPWRPGARSARLEIEQGKSSTYVSLTGIGATCGGPLPGCLSGCADSDGDGLNDAWEKGRGIDYNNDGLINANDLRLPDSDPIKPDIYVQYDWMDYGLPEQAPRSEVTPRSSFIFISR